MEYEIENGIPVPQKGHRDRGFTHTLRLLEVGQSFVSDKPNTSNVTKIGNATGRRFTTRHIDATHVRVWRVK